MGSVTSEITPIDSILFSSSRTFSLKAFQGVYSVYGVASARLQLDAVLITKVAQALEHPLKPSVNIQLACLSRIKSSQELECSDGREAQQIGPEALDKVYTLTEL